MTTMRAPVSLACAAALLAAAAVSAEAARHVEWADLRPAAQPAELTAAHRTGTGRTAMAALDGQSVEITGFLLPSDREDDLVYEFLLVPWAGACSHMPSPAPNQVLRVRPSEPYRALGAYEVVTVTGQLSASPDLTQLFIFDGVATVESAYRLSGAGIVSHGMSAGDQVRHGRSPWSFLGR